jgi:hypothetical protein
MMPRPSPAQLERVRQLLAHEAAASSTNECAAAAGRIYDKLQAHLGPLLGAAGVQALLVRSAKLAHSDFSFLEAGLLEGPTKLREVLQAQDTAIATESAAALFGIFFELLTTFIGERLTIQVLRSAWPMIDETASGETKR